MDTTERSAKVREAQRLRKEQPTLSVAAIAKAIGVSDGTAKRFLSEDPDNPPASLKNKNPKRPEMAKQAIKLRKAGKTRAEVAQALGVSVSTVTAYTTDPTGKRGVRITKNWTRKKQGLPPVTAREEAEVAYNRMEIPVTDKIRMRPVWQRRQRRIYMQNELPPISEEEKADAIKILADKRLQKYAPALYFDAFLILDEAGK